MCCGYYLMTFLALHINGTGRTEPKFVHPESVEAYSHQPGLSSSKPCYLSWSLNCTADHFSFYFLRNASHSFQPLLSAYKNPQLSSIIRFPPAPSPQLASLKELPVLTAQVPSLHSPGSLSLLQPGCWPTGSLKSPSPTSCRLLGCCVGFFFKGPKWF